MGYCISLLHTKFRIPKASKALAHTAILGLFGHGKETIRDGSGPHYSWVDTKTVLASTSLEEAMDEWRYELVVDPNTGDVTDINFTGEKYGDEEVLFGAIAPYVEAESYLAFSGEDGAHWRWFFDGSSVREETGVVTYVGSTP
jgi:hypothetical protein